MRANSRTDILGILQLLSGTRNDRGRPEITFFRNLNEPSLIAPIHSCTVLKHGAESTPNTA